MTRTTDTGIQRQYLSPALVTGRSAIWPYRLSVRWGAFIVLSLSAIGLILWLGRDLTFTWDECVYIARGWDLLRPHNEHWSTVPLVLWKGTGALFGYGSYLPFHALLLGTYTVMTASVYALLRGMYALGAVALLWFLGSGGDQLMWAVQVSFVTSIAAGVWAFYLIEHNRYRWAALLLVVSVASSGMGLPMTAAAITYGLLRRERETAWLALPILIYGAWYLPFGGNTTGAIDPLRMPGFVLEQTLTSAQSTAGLPGLLVAGVVLAMALWRGRDPLFWACLVGIVVEFAIIGLVRAEGAPRYQTTFAVLGLLAVGRIAWPKIMRPVGYAVLALALITNLGWLIGYQYEFALWLPGHSCAAIGL